MWPDRSYNNNNNNKRTGRGGGDTTYSDLNSVPKKN